MSGWHDLSDEELEARLVQRGVLPGFAKVMVEDRDCCFGCMREITEVLDR